MTQSHILVSITVGGEEWEVDVTDQSFVTPTRGGQNVSLLRTPMGVIMVTSDLVAKRPDRKVNVLVFTDKQWETLMMAQPYDIEPVTEP